MLKYAWDKPIRVATSAIAIATAAAWQTETTPLEIIGKAGHYLSVQSAPLWTSQAAQWISDRQELMGIAAFLTLLITFPAMGLRVFCGGRAAGSVWLAIAMLFQLKLINSGIVPFLVVMLPMTTFMLIAMASSNLHRAEGWPWGIKDLGRDTKDWAGRAFFSLIMAFLELPALAMGILTGGGNPKAPWGSKPDAADDDPSPAPANVTRIHAA